MKQKRIQVDGASYFEIHSVEDSRGRFTKFFHGDLLRAAGMFMEVEEIYASSSHQGVIRGMHFQAPPYDHDKIVCCVLGRVTDVLLDLRPSSPTYLQCASVSLSGANGGAVYIPAGVAHGFLAKEDNSMLVYALSTSHHPESDCGVRFDSFGFDWQLKDPTVSDRDRDLPTLSDFSTPFL